jgi:hypothetical protein
MANQDRIERYSKIRTLLDFPREQQPRPHQILTQMLIAEQSMLLRLTNTRQPWHLISSNIVTVDGTSEYTVAQPVSAYQQAGKVHFIIRATDNTDLPYLPVPFDDFSQQNYGVMLPTGTVNSELAVPEKVSVYRSASVNQGYRLVIQPTPQEVLTYTVYFYVGGLDRSQATPTQTGPVTELDDYQDIETCLALLPITKWLDDEEANTRKGMAIGTGLKFQLDRLEPIVRDYIKSINHPLSFDLDSWNE